MRKFGSVVALLSLLALTAGACSSAKDTGFPPVPSTNPSETGPPPGTVNVIDSAFQPQELDVAKGDTITWNVTGSAPHSVTFDDGKFDEPAGCKADASKCSKSGDKFEFKADLAPGKYHYYCVIHGVKGQDTGMYGYIVVK